MARTTGLTVCLLLLLCATVSQAGAPAVEHSAHESQSTASQHPASQHTHGPQSPGSAGAADAKPGWSKEEIDTARARCNVLLSGLKAVTTPVDPIRNGECGTPAPVEVISIGSNPQVTFSTPVVMTCELVAGLHNWLRSDVQPAAKEILGSPVVRLDIMSGYSCRNAYGRKKNKLSEHGRVNAVDVGAFLTSSGESVDVLHYWGQTERDIRAQIAASAAASKQKAAKAEAIKREAERVQTALEENRKATVAAREKPENRRDMAAPGLRGSIGEHSGSPGNTPATLGLQPSHLGGPKAQAKAEIPTTVSAKKQAFLRRVHAAACKAFGTILGPEANEAHRNHFHIDMAERKHGNYCE